MDVEAELKKELKFLQTLFGCAELEVVWRPNQQQYDNIFGKKKQLCGEVIDRTLVIYVTELEDALHVCDHEFIEYYLNKELLDPVITMYNNMRIAYEKSATKNLYNNKEAVIENMVRLIEQKRKEVNKK
ncbi:MAG: hypothetical protein NWE98_02010 [Candidatus Bathyarchaeota archaeon]|nr:hypothetical protein [Candidatus Bathyarchaeota archaeon]